jgi:O-antigen/teichoic acid export membrane protein
MEVSRTAKSITNSKFAFYFYFPNLLLGFISRKVFIDYVGIEILGLNQTAQNLLGFLNLAELGIGSAIAFTLYKPLAVNDQQSINEIVTVQGWLYRRIAIIIGVAAIILMCFFPMIFGNSGLSLWYAYASFGVFLYSSLLTYFINYKQILFSASQQEHLITKHYHFVNLLKSVIQILAMIYLPSPYVTWLILQVLFSTLASLNLNRAINNEFPNLKIDLKQGKFLVKKYDIIITKVKQLFFHAIGGFLLTQSSSIIIYAFVNLTMVGIYGNYMLITHSVRMLFNALFAGVPAGVGNLIAEGDKKKMLAVFEELFTARFLIITTFLYCFLVLSNSFMVIWIGEQYLLDTPTLWVIVLTMYIILSRTTVDNYIFATGLFHDIWAPIVEAVLNIGLSVLLGYFFGIIGVLSGVLISLFLVIFLWKPYFLFKQGLHESFWFYFRIYAKHIVVFVLSFLICELVFGLVKITETSYLTWAFSAILHFLLFGCLCFSLLFLVIPGMRRFTKRMKGVIKSKSRK